MITYDCTCTAAELSLWPIMTKDQPGPSNDFPNGSGLFKPVASDFNALSPLLENSPTPTDAKQKQTRRLSLSSVSYPDTDGVNWRENTLHMCMFPRCPFVREAAQKCPSLFIASTLRTHWIEKRLRSGRDKISAWRQIVDALSPQQGKLPPPPPHSSTKENQKKKMGKCKIFD